jgi:SAM-dependent methyltransferase
MIYHEILGPAVPKLGWVPTPTYILRRACVLDLMRSNSGKQVLEIGPGAGALLHDLSKLGFRGTGVEASDPARNIAVKLLSATDTFQIQREMPPARADHDYLISLEVLEHIENDEQALKDWFACLKKGGVLILSVPSHPEWWSDDDVWAGHFRRYDKKDLIAKLERSGFKVTKIFTYGWPLANMILPVRKFIHSTKVREQRKSTPSDGARQATSTAHSGVDRSTEVKFFPVYASWLGRFILALFIQVQKLFFWTDWGLSYLVVAVKH